MKTVQEIVSDDEVARIHGYANFGPMTPRDVLADGVLKYAYGYTAGYTQLTILREHGLIRTPALGSYNSTLTKKGQAYLRAAWPIGLVRAGTADQAALKTLLARNLVMDLGSAEDAADALGGFNEVCRLVNEYRAANPLPCGAYEGDDGDEVAF